MMMINVAISWVCLWCDFIGVQGTADITKPRAATMGKVQRGKYEFSFLFCFAGPSTILVSKDTLIGNLCCVDNLSYHKLCNMNVLF